MKKLLLFSISLFSFGWAFGQPMYNMTNLTVDDCEGILLDSDAGDLSDTYDHNEDFTFNICIPGADQIIMEFESFCTEADFDFLSIYDGSTLLGVYDGDQDPPTIIATSGCLTLTFTSDPNVACTGWVANWYVVIEEPVPVPILPIPNVPCESSSFTIEFESPILCDSVFPGAFAITGPQLPSIVSATPLNCSGGMTTSVELQFDPPITTSGNYEVTYTTTVLNECDEDFVVVSVGPFAVTDCPLTVEIMDDWEAFCEGGCTEISAEANGGDGLGYTYTWTPSGADTCCIEVCPFTPTMYTVVVSDMSGATAADSVLVAPTANPTINLPNDTTFCQSEPPFYLTTDFSGGEWSGEGVVDEETGLYDPGLVTPPQDIVTYTSDDECESQITINVIALDHGNDDAACIGSAPFQVSGGSPPGGVWSGENITPDGLFTPPDSASSFQVTYTHPNGCFGTKTINIDSIQMPVIDTLCQSDTAFQIPVTPFGGVWSGPGIVDEDEGVFDPEEALSGDNFLYYEINGCIDSMSIFVKAIDARGNFTACPDETPFIVPGAWGPAGGTWTGYGISNPTTGLYDPSLPPQVRDTLTYEVNGCVDYRIAFVLYTRITLDETLGFCPEDDPFELSRQNTGRRPNGGFWSGPGTFNPVDNDWFFDPAVAGVGLHTLYYEANTCVDSMTVEVFPTPNITATTVCELISPFALQVDIPGGEWFGDGIINETQGIFDPGIAGLGAHTISYESPDGCRTEEDITVLPFQEASISGVEDFYCFKDTVVNLIGSPGGGIMTVNGMPMTTFNPAQMGPGEYLVSYTIGEDECQDEATFTIEVGEGVAIFVPLSADTICYGQNTEISVDATGGSSNGQYTYTWSHGLGFGKTHYVNPQIPTTYTVSVSDGCSDIVTGTVTVFVHPPIHTNYTTGPEVCFEDSTWAVIAAFPQADYTYIWDSSPPFYGDSMYSYPTSFNVEVINNETNCSVETLVQLPGFGPITANFGLSPNVDCISTLDPTIEILDFSFGATNGYWDFGDSTTAPYVFGENLTHTYEEPGTYMIDLYLENEGNCPSDFQMMICVNPEHRLFAPNAFTPNLDGKNDVFLFKGVAIKEIEWHIFNRFGEKIFTGESMDATWDGEYKGRRVQPGVYVFSATFRTKYSTAEQVMKGFVTVVY